MTFLRVPTPPRLPDPDNNGDYSPRSRMALLHVLRLYFAQLDAVMQAILGRNGNQFFESPTASYYADTDQVIAGGATVALNVPLLTNEQAFTHPSPSVIVATYAGTYSVRVLLSVVDTGSSTQLKVWLRRNGIDLPTSCTETTIAGASAGVKSVIADYILDLLPTDTLEIMVHADDPVTLHAPPAAPPAPPGVAARVNLHLISSDSTVQVTSPLHRLKKLVA